MHRIAFFAVLFFLVGWLHAKQEPAFDKDTWNDLTEDVEYVEENRESNFSLPNLNLDINSTALKYVLFALIIGLLFYLLIKYVISLQNAGQANAEDLKLQVNNLEEAEANPMQADLEQLVETLLDKEDYRGATRAYFLLVLQRMNRMGLITWEKPKTNFDYVHEVSRHPFHGDFKRATILFEHVWYGNKPQDARRFDQTRKSFQHLLKQLGRE